MTIEAVFFDLDGTLLDTALDFQTAVNSVLEEENRTLLPEGAIREYVTHGSVGIINAVFDVDRDHADFPRLQQSLLSHYKHCMTDQTTLFQGLESSLALLKENGVPWGIVTNKPSEYAIPIVDALLPESVVLICPDHVANSKPDPEGLFMACKNVAVNPKNCLYVGDHLRDIQAGQAAGMTTVAVGWGYIHQTEQYDRWGAEFIAHKPEELAAILEQSLGA